jgi:hypothetical protein
MYTGTLIDQLMDTVERTQARAEKRLQDALTQEEKLAFWYAVAQQEAAQFESSLAGVA